MDKTRRPRPSLPAGSGGGFPRQRIVQAAVAAAVLVFAAFAYSEIRDYLLGRELLVASADDIPSDPTLLAYANGLGKAAFAANCVSCHGGDMKGNQAKGV